MNLCMDIFVNSALCNTQAMLYCKSMKGHICEPDITKVMLYCKPIKYKYVNSATPRPCYNVNLCMDIFVNSATPTCMLYRNHIYGDICKKCNTQVM